jgi:tetratricopeptide (TPR) repeat protein
VSHFARRVEEARAALADAEVQMDRAEWQGAIHSLQRGVSLARTAPWQRDLADELSRRLRVAELGRAAADRTAAAAELQHLADRVRFLYGADPLPSLGLGGLTEHCRALWQQRIRIVERLSPGGVSALEPAARDNLLDLALFWADLQVRLAEPTQRAAARRQALEVLDEAEALFGPSRVLDEERATYGAPPRLPRSESRAPQTAWKHWALGRTLLRAGALERADAELRRAVRLQPQDLWPNFYAGVCAYRLSHYEQALTAFSVCIGAAPEAAACFYNRALALAALGHTRAAQEDYYQALRLDPNLGLPPPLPPGSSGVVNSAPGPRPKSR